MTISDVEYIEFPGFPTAVVRFRELPIIEIHGAMDAAFTALSRAMGEGVFTPTGPAFSRYETAPTETVTFETGFPVEAALAEAPSIDGITISPSDLPACRLATTKHTGPYEALGAAWQQFTERVQTDGHEPGTPFWEAYDTQPGPDVDPATLITGLAVPVTEG